MCDCTCHAPPETDEEMVARLRGLLSKAHALPWEPSWNTKRHDDFEWMEAAGPQTCALKPSHPRYREMVVEQVEADAELMAAAVNALPRLLEIAEAHKSA
jgi:hypothetical protein